MSPEADTIKAMPENTVLELKPNHGQPDAIISHNPLMNKKGSSEKTEAKKGPLTLEEVDNWLNRSFGSALHAAFRDIVSGKLIAEINQQFHKTFQPKFELPRPKVADIFGEPIVSWDDFTEKISRPDTVLDTLAVNQAIQWLELIQPYSLPDSIKDRLRPEQKIYVREQRNTAMRVHAVLLCGLVELWPELNQPNTLVLSEVRLQPPTYAIEQLGKKLHQPTDLNLKTALASGFKKQEGIDDYLFKVLVKKQSLLGGFESLTEKLVELKIIDSPEQLIGFLTEPKTDNFIAHFQAAVDKRDIEPADLQTLKALRLVQLARLQMEFFLGGKALISKKTELIELLKIFPITHSGELPPNETLKDIWEKLPKKMKRILSPIFMAADIFILEMPNEPEENNHQLFTARNQVFMELKKLCTEAYLNNNHPALFQYPKFMSLATKAAALGMKLKLGDIKSSRGPIPETGVKTEHARELGVYNLDLSVGAVIGWLHNLYPTQSFSIFELLRHPLVQAMKENFIFYFGYQKSGKNIIPQIASRTAFTDPANNRKLLQRFVVLARQISNSMLIRHVKNIKEFPVGDDDTPLTDQ